MMSRALLWPTLAGLIFPLFACAGQEIPWYREGMTADQLKQDQKECSAQAQNYGFVNPQLNSPSMGPSAGGGPTGRVVVQSEGDLFRTCMNARGYARVEPPKKPAETK